MTKVAIVFLDGVGLGEDDPLVNPVAAARLPVLTGALGGRRLVAGSGRIDAPRASMVPTDAGLGVKGRPQSATGQTALLTGRNAPLILGEHFGPRPNAALRAMLEGPTLFTRLVAEGRTVAFVNAYPQGYFDAVARGKRLHGAIPQAAQAAGLRLRTAGDLAAGQALSVDLTNAAWRSAMGYPDMPLWTPWEAGQVLARLSAVHDLVFFDNWATDVAGHGGKLAESVRVLEEIDAFLGGLLAAVDLENTLVAIISDHGNIEDLRAKGHTENLVPTMLIGAGRQRAADAITDLTHVMPAVLDVIRDA
ncbi:MAG TPA: sulfatase-like hydrolase/transferase [Anaerolineae bacterium]|nr:sulfatase-like hydrolase/transferase [Anaerolineae bacterium]HNU06110.1 sulfatase-like hydrolase/transferase [Anaerolineae bacterium]